MTCLELVILIIAVGFVSMIEICAITICVGKVLDERMKVKTQVEYKIFKAEMNELKDFIKECIKMFIPEGKMSEPNTTTYTGYGKHKPVKPIAVKMSEEQQDDEKDDDWLKI